MPRSHRHNLSSQRLLTADIGQLVPCGLVEVLPGDKFRHNASALVRLSPMAAPVYHAMSIRLHHFFVPHRLTWEFLGESGTFEDFITGGSDGRDAQVVPQVTTTGVASDVLDYLGCPPVSGISVNALPLAAFNLIYNEWYRDQDLAIERTNKQTDVPNIAYEKDYFTAARPWAQKGEEVSLPLGDTAPVVSDVQAGGHISYYNTVDGANRQMGASNPTVDYVGTAGLAGHLLADLSQATAATINSLRRASALQRFAEARARWGSRYAEYIRHEFGARPLDARLQRPEYLGGGTQRVSVSEILQTAPDDSTDPRFGVGDLYGHGIGATRSNRYRVRFSEHGYVVSMFSVRPRAMYSDGVERTWLRKDREDFYQPQLAYIGQQQVLEQEVYADATNADAVFGWNDRYHEYREVRSLATGEFRNLLDYWHLSRKFGAAPALNQTFVEVTPSDTKRIFNEQSQHSLWVTMEHQVQALRPVPRNAEPRLL